MTKIVITGAAGFIGSHVTDLMINQGHDVLAIDNLSFGRREQLNPQARFWEIDLGRVDGDVLTERLSGFAPTHVIHLAAIHFIPYCMEHPDETFSSNVRSTEALVRAVAAGDTVRRLLAASTMDVYAPSDSVHRESDTPSPRNVYGLSKLLTENITRFAAETIEGLSAICFRFANVYGTRETNPHLIPDALDRVLDPGPAEIRMGNLAGSRDFIHVSDVAQAISQLLDHDVLEFDLFNLGSGVETSVRRVVEMVRDAAGDARPITEDAAKFRKFDRKSLTPDIGKILSETKWTPQIAIEDGLTELVAETRRSRNADGRLTA
ncbi:MAG: NAD-dependent epimerase/dehydratase family protein [Alphaproteobacteria bacterium]|nr:NAD-dependent epimerase/dehydratase family protein [Alphaproteobacteria bacterium]